MLKKSKSESRAFKSNAAVSPLSVGLKFDTPSIASIKPEALEAVKNIAQRRGLLSDENLQSILGFLSFGSYGAELFISPIADIVALFSFHGNIFKKESKDSVEMREPFDKLCRFILSDKNIESSSGLIEALLSNVETDEAKFRVTELSINPKKIKELHLSLMFLEAAMFLAGEEEGNLRRQMTTVCNDSRFAIYPYTRGQSSSIPLVSGILAKIFLLKKSADGIKEAKLNADLLNADLRGRFDILPENFGKKIDWLNNRSTHERLGGLLDKALNDAFELVSFPETKRVEFKEKLLSALINHDIHRGGSVNRISSESEAQVPTGLEKKDASSDAAAIRAPDGGWVEKVKAERTASTPQARIDLPQKAPATWRDDKQLGDTPPDFIRRHYGPFLRADATGLTRPDIKRLDRPLYVGLANWLRKNSLPDDCPVPIRSERVDAELALAMHERGALQLEDLERLAKAERYRRRTR